MATIDLTESETNKVYELVTERLLDLNKISRDYGYCYSGHVPDWLKAKIQELENLHKKLRNYVNF